MPWTNASKGSEGSHTTTKEAVMKRRRFLTVTVGVMALSVGLILMTDSAGAAPKDKSGGNPTQNS